jgi:sulfite dehydrogenase (cytochrome) subunit B
MFRYLLTAVLLSAVPAMAEEQVALKPGPGLDVVTATCSTCHTLDYIRMNSVFLTPDEWKAEVTKMQQAFGGPFDDATAAAIVKYLSVTYAAPPKS